MIADLGKKAEGVIKKLLDHPEMGYCLDRLPDQMTGMYGSRNICDFTLYKKPYMWYIESKATEHERFDFSMISGFVDGSDGLQYPGMLKKSVIDGVFTVVIVLFATQKRAFVISIKEIQRVKELGVKSLNIKKIDKWPLEYRELDTVPSRKQLLDYVLDTSGF